uniref:Uncharacterized protein n=1 Tax=Ascaris lumbricoides TaxID=6252 RepID=A0A0M3INK7_ASCLU
MLEIRWIFMLDICWKYEQYIWLSSDGLASIGKHVSDDMNLITIRLYLLSKLTTIFGTAIHFGVADWRVTDRKARNENVEGGNERVS